MEKKEYSTQGKKKLLNFLQAHPDVQFTAEELCIAVNGNAECGKSSVYRRLSKLCEENVVGRWSDPDRNVTVYQYIGTGCDCARHFHEKCTVCGKIRHLDCSDSVRFALHLLEEHHFEIDCARSVLYGLCGDCRRAKEGKV